MKRSLIPVELICWLTALLALALHTPDQDHFTICPLSNLGITWCPGCGLGRSVSFLLHGDVYSSFKYHWFGVPATLIIINRTWFLLRAFVYSMKPKLQSCIKTY